MITSQAISPTNYVKALTVGDLIRYVFRIYGEHFFILLFVNGVVTLTTVLSFYNGFYALGILNSIFNAVNIIVCSRAILRKPLNLGELYRNVFNSPFRGTIVLFSLFLLPIFALILIFPDSTLINAAATGLILFLSIFYSSIVLVEKKGFRAALKKFFYLMYSNFWNIASKFLVGFLIYWIASTILTGLFSSFSPDYGWALADVICSPVINLVGVFLYYDSRVRKENYTEELLAEEMGYQPTVEMMSA